jgi:hypothetical protein
MKLLYELGDDGSGPGGVERASFVAAALHEMSVVLCRGDFLLYRVFLGMLAKSSGSGFQAGMRVLTDEYDGETFLCSHL